MRGGSSHLRLMQCEGRRKVELINSRFLSLAAMRARRPRLGWPLRKKPEEKVASGWPNALPRNCFAALKLKFYASKIAVILKREQFCYIGWEVFARIVLKLYKAKFWLTILINRNRKKVNFLNRWNSEIGKDYNRTYPYVYEE